MPIAEKVETYSVYVSQNNYLPSTRVIRLALESGGTVYIGFPPVLPPVWLEFAGDSTTLYMTADEYDDVYHVLQTEAPVFFTAISLFGLQVGAVHTELDLSAGEPPGEGDHDPQSLEALIRLAQAQAAPAGGAAA
jgi:hypothetical protein